MLPDTLGPLEEIARKLDEYNKRLSHLERLETPGGVADIGARVFNSADITISNATLTALTFDSERKDTDNIHSIVANTSRLTCNTAGNYYMRGQASFPTNPAGRRFIAIRVNGVDRIVIEEWDANEASSTHMGADTSFDLAVGDYIELTVFQSRGGDLDVVSVAKYSPEFMMQMIAPT